MASSTAALGYPSFPVTVLAGIFLVLALMPGTSSAHSVSQDSYHNNPLTYLFFSFVMSFGTISFVLGIFAFKYGKKRTRIYSVPMMASGTVIWALWFYFNFVAQAEYPDDTVFSIIHWVAAPLLKPVMALLGAGLGLALALIIFLNSIVRA